MGTAFKTCSSFVCTLNSTSIFFD
ncbi:hypothetical protein LINPERPRIM_LOCUS39734 [Linum perenne]